MKNLHFLNTKLLYIQNPKPSTQETDINLQNLYPKESGPRDIAILVEAPCKATDLSTILDAGMNGCFSLSEGNQESGKRTMTCGP